MLLLKPTGRFYLCLIIVLVFNSLNCIAQQIKLKDVTKIEFLYRAGGLMSDGRLVEIVPENNNWNSYQTRLVQEWNFKKKTQIDDSSRTFIRAISANVLNQLLVLIAKPDTGINPNLFDIHKDLLVKYIDTLFPHLKPAQKAAFAKAVQQDSTIKKMLIKVNDPFMLDDRNYYSVTVTTRANKTYKVYARSFANSYYMPWIINNKESFNPHIAEIFESVGGNDDYVQQEKKRLYLDIDRFTYLTYFRTRFSWNDLQEDEPDLYAAMKNTLTPVLFALNDKGGSGTFLSKLLPVYVQLKLSFLKGDIGLIKQYKQQEDSLAKVFKKNNFLFDYIKDKPARKAYIWLDEMFDHGAPIFRSIKKYYPEIGRIDYKQTYLIDIVEANGNKPRDMKKSKWLLLPNNNVILLLYNGTLNMEDDMKFNRIILTDKGLSASCLVFDSSGKKIAGANGPVDISTYYQ